MPTGTSEPFITITVANADELFVGPPTGVWPRFHLDANATTSPPCDWDDVGAVLGESGITRLLRLAAEDRRATRLIVNVRGAGTLDSEGPRTRLRAWCDCRHRAVVDSMRIARRRGILLLLASVAFLTVALTLSWLLQDSALFGKPGAFRTVISEAIVIAGWVAVWRPLEMLLFDPLPHALENRALKRLLAMTWEFRGV